MSSDAPIKEREEAIHKLKEQFDTSYFTQKARDQMKESAPDTSDIGED
jgi:hypothetical protein